MVNNKNNTNKIDNADQEDGSRGDTYRMYLKPVQSKSLADRENLDYREGKQIVHL